MIESDLLEVGGNPSTKSILMQVQGFVGTSRGIYKPALVVPPFPFPTSFPMECQ
jgi:hypothetical protein